MPSDRFVIHLTVSELQKMLEAATDKALAEKVSEPIMVGASNAAALLGVGRTQFNNYPKKYPSLEAWPSRRATETKFTGSSRTSKHGPGRCVTLRPGQAGPCRLRRLPGRGRLIGCRGRCLAR